MARGGDPSTNKCFQGPAFFLMLPPARAPEKSGQDCRLPSLLVPHSAHRAQPCSLPGDSSGPLGMPPVPLAPATPSHLRLYSSRSLFTLASTL